jgi:hypothetical protein
MKYKPLLKSLEHYRCHGNKKVKGWLLPGAVEMVIALSEAQLASGITGHIGEIGVYQGKLFTLLSLLRRSGEKALAVDLFDLGVLHSAATVEGDRAKMVNNLKRYADLKDVTIHQSNSMDLSIQSLVELTGGEFRLFSVDGGHTADIVEHDLEIAENSLAQGGILIHDDFFNEIWPDVAVATVRYFDKPRTIVPFALGGNKTMFCHPAYAARYRTALSGITAIVYERSFLGHEVLSLEFRKSSWLQKMRNQIRKILPV